jgi:hypothetical protein
VVSRGAAAAPSSSAVPELGARQWQPWQLFIAGVGRFRRGNILAVKGALPAAMVELSTEISERMRLTAEDDGEERWCCTV